MQIRKDSAIIQARGERYAAGQVQNPHTGALMAYAQEAESGRYSFGLNSKATEKCKVYDALHEQQDCALFFLAMCILHGDSYQSPAEDTLLGDLSDVICYVDFSNIFDRNAAQKRHAVRQKKAESMFRPGGITLNFGTEPHRYLAFERSNSMSHRAQLSFVREDIYEPLRRRLMLDMEIGPCQLSKLYAYNGLMLSGGTRIDGIEIDRPLTTLNYQFLNTVSMTADEFRPPDLPLGWEKSPEDYDCHWLTKETELAYYNYCADEEFRKQHFLSALERRQLFRKNKAYRMAEIMKKNPLFINEPVYTKELDAKAEQILNQYALGQLIVAGDNRFLSGDLLEFLSLLLPFRGRKKASQRTFLSVAMTNRFADNSYYAPKAAYEHGGECTLLRNPHIARNEDIQLSWYAKVDQMRKHYLGHLTDVVMVDSHTLAAERLGGADFDGDMIKAIAAPILNACVKRNYQEFSTGVSRQTSGNIPLLKIPAVELQIRDANDWYARFETVRNTFSSRVGQISNTALDRSVIAYNENSDSDLRQRCREETEILAILTGLEIDSAKSGVKPDLSEYLNKKIVNRSLFLQYKKLLDSAETRGKWYEPTFQQKRKAFLDKTDWSAVDSNLERLPHLAYQLKQNTQKLKPTPAKDSELFAFAQETDWKERLDPQILFSVSELTKDYEACLSRIRACRVPIQKKNRKNDIERILFSRGQEDVYDADELYAAFQDIPAERIAGIRAAIIENKWHFMDEDSRQHFLRDYLPELAGYHELFSDFRHGGYRVLGDLICDIDDENQSTDRKKYLRNTDSTAFRQMMNAYLEQPLRHNYREVVAARCRELLDEIIKPRLAVQYIVALGERDLLWDLLIDHIEENVLKEEPHAE